MCSDIARGAPSDTRDFLVTLDPAFESKLAGDEPGDLNHHRIMMSFAEHFGANHSNFSEKQLRRLGEWLSASVASGGEIENAVSTCFLEHTRQLKVNRVLAPFLSQLAKGKTHA